MFVQNSQRLIVPENVSSATLRGEEVSARGRLADRVALSLNYTHQDATDDSDVPYLQGNQLPGRPPRRVLRPHRAPSGRRAGRCRGWRRSAPFTPRVFFDANLIGNNYLNRANTEQVGSRTLLGTGFSFGSRPAPSTRCG